MTRPAIIIGLGGTGQWVLTYLKKELLEIGGGTMPPGVRLLSFDTTTQTAAVAGAGGPGSKEQNLKVGAVRLDMGTEFIPIGENIKAKAGQIAQGMHPHLQWFPAGKYINRLPEVAFNLQFGSGQIRQMGRMALFNDVGKGNGSRILSYIQKALKDLHAQVNEQVQLEVIIISSFAGGTGAGMLVDMAEIVRAQASATVAKHFILRGFFVLPSAFGALGLAANPDMLARSFAAWRELDRFMILSEKFGQRKMIYHETEQNLQVNLGKRAYDVTYLVDTVRDINSLDTTKPEEGVFPAIANSISAILDDRAGKEFTEYVSTNLSGHLATVKDRKALHSTIGSYTLKVPVYYASEKFSHQLSLEVLQRFLEPNEEKGSVSGVRQDRNAEAAAGSAGYNAVIDFMGSAGITVDGQNIPNLNFLPLVANIRKVIKAQNDGPEVSKTANYPLSKAGSPWQRALTDFSQDPQGKPVQLRIDRYLHQQIWQVPGCGPSREAGDTPEDGYTRLVNNIAKERPRLYGLPDQPGAVPQRGEYGNALKEAQANQMQRFQHLLEGWLKQALNGVSTDPLAARGGKIGFVQAFFEEMVETFKLFKVFIGKVRDERNKTLKLSLKTRGAAEAARRNYDNEKDRRCWLAFWDNHVHPDAHRAQREYLFAEQRDIDVRKDDILLDVIYETAQEMLAYSQASLDEINSWICHLATGMPGKDVTGLYPDLKTSLDNVSLNHNLDRGMKRVSKLIGEHEYESDLRFIKEAIQSLCWEIQPGPNGIQLSCGINFPDSDPTLPPRWVNFRRDGDKPGESNRRLLLDLCQIPYYQIRQEIPLAKEVMKQFPKGEQLAKDVNKMGEPMYAQSPNTSSPRFIACFVRVNWQEDDLTEHYFRDEFMPQLQALNAQITNMQLVEGSEDRYKMTIVRSDDLLPSSNFAIWHQCRQAYINRINDPHNGIEAEELHIHPAEINACFYERQIPRRLAKDYRALHPEVVALLEDRDRIDMFFRAIALGYIQKVVDTETQAHHWVYQLPEEQPLWLSLPVDDLMGTQRENFFDVIDSFVISGCDQRPGMGLVKIVDWEQLKRKILSEQRKQGRTDVTNRYKYQIENPEGFVRLIRQEIAARRSQEPNPSLRVLIGQELEDLADLANVIYLLAIESVSSLGDNQSQSSQTEPVPAAG